MYQDFRYNLKQGIADTNMDILAIRNEKEDMLDEISKRNNPTPKDGEIVIKIDQILKNQYIEKINNVDYHHIMWNLAHKATLVVGFILMIDIACLVNF